MKNPMMVYLVLGAITGLLIFCLRLLLLRPGFTTCILACLVPTITFLLTFALLPTIALTLVLIPPSSSPSPSAS